MALSMLDHLLQKSVNTKVLEVKFTHLVGTTFVSISGEKYTSLNTTPVNIVRGVLCKFKFILSMSRKS